MAGHGDWRRERLNMTRATRRWFARSVLAALLLVHLGAFWAYGLYQQQFAFLAAWREGQDAFRHGQLEDAAARLREFADGYRRAIQPLLLRSDYPEESQAWAALGQVEQRRGQLRPAADAYARAGALGSAAAWRERQELLWQLGDARALQQQGEQRLARGGGETLPAYQDLAAAAWCRGDAASAVRYWETALQQLPAWLRQQGRPARAADGGLTDEAMNLHLLAGTAAWLAGDVARGRHHCALLAAAQDPEARADGLCRAAAARAAGNTAAVAGILATTPLAGAAQAALAAALTAATISPSGR